MQESNQQEETEPKSTLIIDTNVFIKHPEIHQIFAEFEVMTTKSVISELRDPNSKQKAKLNYGNYKIAKPSDKAVAWVINFAKKTGDYVSISKADTEVIALAVEEIWSKGLKDELYSEPKKGVCLMKSKEDNNFKVVARTVQDGEGKYFFNLKFLNRKE